MAEGEAPLLKPSFPGEDTRPTSKKEVWGWYSYGWAAEVFVVCGVGSFIPITLEQLARERGVLLSDKTTPCSPKSQVPQPPGFNSTSVAAIDTTAAANQCVVFFLGRPINTASFAMYTFSLSVLVQALLIVSMSGAADHGRFRKTLLLIFAFTGSLATMAFLPITAPLYYFGALLAIIANTCFGASFVLLNSFLPLMVRNHPETRARLASRRAEHNDDESYNVVRTASGIDGTNEARSRTTIDSSTALLRSESFSENFHDGTSRDDEVEDDTRPFPASAATVGSSELQLSTKISSAGIGIGYIAAVIVQIISVFMVKATGGSTFSLRLVLFFVGAWWFFFSIPSAIYLRARPGPPLQAQTKSSSSLVILWAYIASSWVRLYQTFHRARSLKDVLLFLAAWFLLSDAIATVSGTAVLFAKTTLNMSAAALALINVVVMLSGVLGAAVWPLLPLSPSHTILAALAIFELIPLYALLGYIPAVQRWGVLGLQQSWEMYLLALFYGLVLGGISSYCRAVFGDLIPPGSEAAFYALYAITDKGSSIFGPAVVGAITDRYGEIRPAFVFLAVLIAAPFPLMALVNIERGKSEAKALARALKNEGPPAYRIIGSSSPSTVLDDGDDEVANGHSSNTRATNAAAANNLDTTAASH